MSSTGSGYDYSPSTYSPDGRIFQVEYAQKAIENSGIALGLCTKDGVVLAVEKLLVSNMLVPGSNRRIHSADKHVGVAFSGYTADGRVLAKKVRVEARKYKARQTTC